MKRTSKQCSHELASYTLEERLFLFFLARKPFFAEVEAFTASLIPVSQKELPFHLIKLSITHTHHFVFLSAPYQLWPHSQENPVWTASILPLQESAANIHNTKVDIRSAMPKQQDRHITICIRSLLTNYKKNGTHRQLERTMGWTWGVITASWWTGLREALDHKVGNLPTMTNFHKAPLPAPSGATWMNFCY